MTSCSSHLSRRHFLRYLGGASLWSIFPWQLRAHDSDFDLVSILHTTDLHGNILPTTDYSGATDLGGIARCATRLRQWRKMQPDAILLDCGDLYQGTDVGHRTLGKVMIDCFNQLDYDGWVIGNHEFDWGYDALEGAIAHSEMPALAANCRIGGQAPQPTAQNSPLKNLQPYTIQVKNGYKIAILALTTPNMEYWFLPEILKDFSATDPVTAARATIDHLQEFEPDAIVLVSHMGIRPGRNQQDDAANRLRAVIAACPEIDLIIGGHTHRSFAKEYIARTPYTQAGYFGIQCGRVDLVFDRHSRRLIHTQPMLSTMDASVPQDKCILTLTQPALNESQKVLETIVGHLEQDLDIQSRPGHPSASEKLIGAAIIDGLQRHGRPVDAAIHGLLYQDEPFAAGDKTVQSLWQVIPFENFSVTATLSYIQLAEIILEVSAIRNHRSLLGMRAQFRGRGESLQLQQLENLEGHPLPHDRSYRVAFNSYDAAGGGGRFPKLKQILNDSPADRKLLPYQTRTLLAEFFDHYKTISLSLLTEISG